MIFTGCGNQPQETAATPPPDSGPALQPTEPPIPAPKVEPTPAQDNQKPTETAQAPEGMPLPIYTGFKLGKTMRTQTSDSQGMQAEIIGDAPLQAVSDFYEAEFKKRGLKVSKMTQKTSTGDEALVLGES
ncbi:MAG: hypothetical protein NZM28_07565, partial [Fimbriimonadales bacterium]|nr:hypothetical protein [Fimbriimonadales bacterium]